MFADYKSLFGLDIKLDKMNVKDLPIYLTVKRSFYKAACLGVEFVLVDVPNDEKFGVIALQKQTIILSDKYGKPVAFCFEDISRSQRNSLIAKNIPFISDSGQLYLPFLGVILHNRFVNRKETKSEKMMPVTQALFLYMLYRSKAKPVMKKDAAETMGVTRTSITRASEQLLAMGLISQQQSGKEYYMSLTDTGISILDKAKPYLINPVQRKMIISKEKKYTSCLLSGESALARTTDLNEPRITVRAVYKAEIEMDRIQEVDTRWEPDADVICLELWKYDPALFSMDGIVDPVSLSLCFEDNADERIESAVEEYLEGYQW